MKSCSCRSGVRSLILVFVAVLFNACDQGTSQEAGTISPAAVESVHFVGSRECSACHEQQHEAWSGSHHDLAMQHATEKSVIGDFDNATAVHGGIESLFFNRDGRYWVKTENAIGELAEFEILYAFGVEPLQQYLIEFSNGNLQALPLAWDARDESEGGQRWFHVYGDEIISYDNPLHWTGREQNWNYMCAECHTTNLQKNFDLENQAFDTTWSEINVGCEGCHGPASQHVAMAKTNTMRGAMGLSVDLDDAGRAVWRMNPGTGIAERSEFRMRPPQQPESCGRCHSRRALISDQYEFGRALLDTHMPSLLEEDLYFPDGQIREEVYVWGSFVQSKMYQAGVSCTDCHDPHTAKLKTAGAVSDICSTCHLPDKFSASEHHGHADGQVACVDCHMPSRDFMVIDGRRDHSFRVPRPDLTISTGSPNACADCHEQQGPEWASARLTEWFGDSRPAHYAEALAAGRQFAAGANTLLIDAASDTSYPGIARATAFSLISPPMDSMSVAAIGVGLSNADALIRLGALRALEGASGDIRIRSASVLLADPVRAVRIEAARLLSPMRSALPQNAQASFAVAEGEYIASQLAIVERPEAHINLASIFIARGDAQRAESSYQQALEMEPRAITARVNLADLYRQLDRDEDAEVLLQKGLELDSNSAALRHSLGLLLIRADQADTALAELERAVVLDPENSRFIYVYAVGLNTVGRIDEAIDTLRIARDTFSGDFNIGWALITILRDAGHLEEARSEALKLREQYPENSDIASFLAAATSQQVHPK